ncbi:hypothetical protein JZ751_001762 [Albula glossodonta]|uniref:Uncharacterized protein n=1 Tax=Albula glossodonta TaxID=121402 RepID=A0A8T2PUM2_9TELE|nr:hypothetical protein JZ751_001762 [Albula glossodonta]
MDSDSDSPFNYSWPSFHRMRIHRRTSRQGKNQSVSPVPSTFTAAARLSAMLNGKDRVCPSAMLLDQVDNLDTKYSIAGVTADSSLTETGGSDTLRGGPSKVPTHFLDAGLSCSPVSPACIEEGQGARFTTPHREQSPPAPSFPPPSPPNLTLARLHQPALADPLSQRGSPPQETCTLSPGLLPLEVDSEEDDLLGKTPLSHVPASSQLSCVLQASSGDEQDSFDASPDLSCSRAHSASSYNPPPTKDSGDQGVRLRSYSYSSPKISLVRPRFTRDVAIGDLSEEQRTLSLSEQPSEKREIRFRKRAQSAEDEGSAALADSLQHLTLSEFLKEYVGSPFGPMPSMRRTDLA